MGILLLSTPEESLLKIVNRIIDDLLEADKNQKRKEKIQDGAKKIFKERCALVPN